MRHLPILFLLFILFAATGLNAQCINTFPFTENFEANNGGWVAGGTANDWQWGTPSKPTIAQAASGSNCWVVGGLSASFYNLGERSYVQSPCFDFSTLQYPIVSFNIFWESEKTYDGANLQSSIDGGTTWVNVGSYNEPANCLAQNWYNTSNITNLSPLATIREGWSGNVQQTQGSCQGGNGSRDWVIAKHCVADLAGKPNVMFRFTFGAGTTCNDFDGIAFDDFSVTEAPANVTTISYNCQANNTVTFTTNSTLCPSTFSWNFGDGNTGTQTAPTHTYNAPGTYTITVNASGPCMAPTTDTKTVEILDAQITSTNVLCYNGSDGQATATTTSVNGPFTYTWSTTPPQSTPTISGIAAGTYAVSITSGSACPGIATTTITQPDSFTTQTVIVPDTCPSGKASVKVTTSGGTPPYQYIWTNGNNTAQIINVSSGSYTLTITDANNCTNEVTALVAVVSPVKLAISKKDVGCLSTNNGTASAVATGGTAPYAYTWQNNQQGNNLSHLTEGQYIVTATDANNCSATDSVIVEKEICRSYVYFPTAFSPNGDGVNETFKPKYSPDLQKFQILIYNRWGEMVFETNDINQGWDGYYKGVLQPLSVYVWVADYSFMDGNKHTDSGNITIIK